MASRQMPGVSKDLLIKKNVIFYCFTCLYSFSAFNNGILPYLDNILPYCFAVWVGILPDRVGILVGIYQIELEFCRIELVFAGLSWHFVRSSWHLPNRVGICRIELAWLKRQNSNLAFHKNDLKVNTASAFERENSNF